MWDMTDDDRKQVLGEALWDELKAIREGIANLPTRTEFNELREIVTVMKTGMEIVKDEVRSQSAQLLRIENILKRHDKDITFLKRAAA